MHLDTELQGDEGWRPSPAAHPSSALSRSSHAMAAQHAVQWRKELGPGNCSGRRAAPRFQHVAFIPLPKNMFSHQQVF